jgi:hypothetical protein
MGMTEIKTTGQPATATRPEQLPFEQQAELVRQGMERRGETARSLLEDM